MHFCGCDLGMASCWHCAWTLCTIADTSAWIKRFAIPAAEHGKLSSCCGWQSINPYLHLLSKPLQSKGFLRSHWTGNTCRGAASAKETILPVSMSHPPSKLSLLPWGATHQGTCLSFLLLLLPMGGNGNAIRILHTGRYCHRTDQACFLSFSTCWDEEGTEFLLFRAG